MGYHHTPTTLAVTNNSECFPSYDQLSNPPCQGAQTLILLPFLWPERSISGQVLKAPVVKKVYLTPRNFARHGDQFFEVARYLPCPFIRSSLSWYPYFLFAIPVSTLTLNSGSKFLTCSNGGWWPLAASAGSICRLLYWSNHIIFTWELSQKSDITEHSNLPECKWWIMSKQFYVVVAGVWPSLG